MLKNKALIFLRCCIIAFFTFTLFSAGNPIFAHDENPSSEESRISAPYNISMESIDELGEKPNTNKDREQPNSDNNEEKPNTDENGGRLSREESGGGGKNNREKAKS